MGSKKRDHFNPVLLLRRFADASGDIHVFDKRHPHLGVHQIGPKALYVHKHLYSEMQPDGTRHRELDDFYTALEGVTAPIVEKIIIAARRGVTPGLSAEEKNVWNVFLYNQWRRVPDSYERFLFDEMDLSALLGKFAEKYRPLTEEEKIYWARPETFSRLLHNVRVGALKRQSARVLNALDGRGLGVAVVTKPTKSFITGSFPVVKLTNPATPQLDHPDTEVWIAIAHDVAVTPSGIRGEERVVEVKDDRHIRGINRALFKQSTSIAGRSKALIASLAGLS